MRPARPIIGLLGGMGWPSTGRYYTVLNGLAAERRQTIHIMINSLAFDDIAAIAETDGFDAVGDVLADEAQRLERAGAFVILLCAVTAHLAHQKTASAVSVPVPHIGRAIGRHVRDHSETTFGFLGTRPALTDDALGFSNGGLIPSPDCMDTLDRAIRHDIAFGRIGPNQIEAVESAAADLKRQGATAIVLACTELGLLSDRLSSFLPKVDAVELHCRDALETAGGSTDLASA
ncbi:MAG: aspartate/glutamate racemase family protein [Pseudomonadota bacterium]